MKTVIRHLIASIATILITTVDATAASQSIAGDAIDLSGEWKILYDDTNPGQTRDYNDASVIRLPGNWNEVLKRKDSMSATVRLMKDIHIDRKFSVSELFLDLGEIGAADKAYFNGTYIGGTGGIPSSENPVDYHFAWKTTRHYLIPKPLVRFNGSNRIEILVYSHVISGINGKIQIRAIKDGVPDRSLSDTIPLLVHHFAITLDFFSLVIFMLLFLYDKRQMIYLYIVIQSLCAIIINLCVLDVPLYMNGMHRFKALLIAYTSIALFMLMSLRDLFNRRNRWSSTLLPVTFCLVVFCICAAWSTKMLMVYVGAVVVAYVTACQIGSLSIFVMAVIRDFRRYWLFLLAVPVIISTARNTYHIIRMDFNAVYFSIFLHLPILITITFFFLYYNSETRRRTGETMLQLVQRRFQNLQREFNRAKKSGAKPSPNEIIHELIAHLDEHYSLPYDRIGLSRKFGLNENYMIQLFKKTTGNTISDYINKQRIRKATELMADEGINIIDVAYNVGFENYNYFHRIFKRETGMSPGQYRKQNRK